MCETNLTLPIAVGVVLVVQFSEVFPQQAGGDAVQGAGGLVVVPVGGQAIDPLLNVQGQADVGVGLAAGKAGASDLGNFTDTLGGGVVLPLASPSRRG